MSLLLFPCIGEHFIIGGFFLPVSAFIAPLPSPVPLRLPGAPCRTPELLVFGGIPGDKSREWGPAMIRLWSAERQAEEKAGRRDRWEAEEEEEVG